jgi:molecular chaperone DnaK (HSP70)
MLRFSHFLDPTFGIIKEFAEEDKKVKERIDSRNGSESHLYNLKHTLDDNEKGLADNISAEDKKEEQQDSGRQEGAARQH